MLNTRCFVLSVLIVLTLFKENACYFDVNTNANITKDARSNRAFPTTCQEALGGSNKTEGIFLVQLPNYPDPFYVNCIKSASNETWTLVQRRQNGLVDFDRGWGEYVTGFGDLNGEFFIGLKKLYALTFGGQELWIQLEDFRGNRAYARYEFFMIGDESTRYTLYNIASYEGTAGNTLHNNLGKQFFTKDMDNKYRCAKERRGGWWYDNCSKCNLNGQYYGNNAEKPTVTKGINWWDFHDNFESLKYAHMAIRKVW